ncbi:GDSL-type esterase/lipase family protein [Corynebacterium poyangense]|nr:GDSL-type esterase/lipase family protein [Corynebacterium poyangense]
MSRSLAASAALAVVCALAQPIASADIVNQPFASPGRDGVTIDTQAALNPDTYQNPAEPQSVQPGNMVTFGDSIMANSTAGDVVFSMATKGVAKQDPKNRQIISEINPNINSHGCAQGSPSIPKDVSAQLGVPLNDYSCPGAVLYTANQGLMTISQQVDNAISDGALNDTTKYVLIQGGYNDIYNNYLTLTGEEANDEAIAAEIGQSTQRDLFARAIDDVINRVRVSAPHAKISLLGYHTITDNTPAGWQCIYHIGDGRENENVWNANGAFPVFWDTLGEVHVQKWMSEAASRNGVQFVDQRDFSAGHGECAAPQDRWVAGILLDTTTGSHNLALHLTDTGVHALSGHIVEQIR